MLELHDNLWSSLRVGVENETGEAAAKQLRLLYASDDMKSYDWEPLDDLLFVRMYGVHPAAFAAFPHLVQIARSHGDLGIRFRCMGVATRILTFSLGMPHLRADIPDSLLQFFDAAVEDGSSLVDQFKMKPRKWSSQAIQYFSMIAAFVEKRPDIAYIMEDLSGGGLACPNDCCDVGIDPNDLHPFE